jgi:uncharacterized lipoprotein YddW (UPF0748 family)
MAFKLKAKTMLKDHKEAQIRSPLKQIFFISIFAVLLLIVGSYIVSSVGGGSLLTSLLASAADESELRGVWVQHRSLTDREKVDEVIRRAEAGRFNAIFVNVFVFGQALYDSDLVTKFEKVEPGFNPLAYLVGEAHRRQIKVHTWFANGPVAYRGTSDILVAHPDWGIVGPDGKETTWLNFSHPEVQQFISDIMLEVIEKYQVDGVHFDYFRYPGPEWGFDPYNLETFSQKYGFDANELRYADLPAYATFSGNALGQPKTAQVLATFQNGKPAVLLNVYGDGKVILLNWDATKRQVAIGSEILQRSLNYLVEDSDKVYLLYSQANAAQYGDGNFNQGMRWLEDLGWTPRQVEETEVKDLSPDSVVVIPNTYILTPQGAADLAGFVRKGGGVIFIDGPTRSIKLDDVQTITGMEAVSGHFNETMLMLSAIEHPLLPQSARNNDLATYERRAEQWLKFRQQGLNTLLENVYRRIKAGHPRVIVSVTITSDQERASQEVLQDWSAWLDGGYIDLLIPRVFKEQTPTLLSTLAIWEPVIRTNDKITFGLIGFTHSDDTRVPKSPEQLLTEIDLVQAAGSNGFMIFNSDNLSEAQLQALTADFLASAKDNN